MLKKKGRSEWILQSYSRRLLWDSTWRSCARKGRSVCKSTIYKIQIKILCQILIYVLQKSTSFIKEYNPWLFHIHLKVFDHDWFATPFVMLTCQVSAKVYSHRRTFDLLWFRALGYLMTLHGKATVVFYVSPIWQFKLSRSWRRVRTHLVMSS